MVLIETLERILIKLTIIQFVFLLIAQVFFHQLNVLPELKVITQYEGVVKEKNAELVEAIWGIEKAEE